MSDSCLLCPSSFSFWENISCFVCKSKGFSYGSFGLWDPLNFLSLALDLYSLKLNLLSPELFECLCNRISSLWVLSFPILVIQCLLWYLPSSRECIYLSVMLFSILFLLALMGSVKLLSSLPFAQDHEHFIVDYSSFQMVMFLIIIWPFYIFSEWL